MQTGDLIRGARGAAALVIDSKDDGLHVVTTRGAAVWPVADYQECETPPMGLLRSATSKAETLTKQRDAALAKVETQRTQHEARKKKINEGAVSAGISHGIGEPLDNLLHKYGMDGRPRYINVCVQVLFKGELAKPGQLSREMNYNQPWNYGNNDTRLLALWSYTMQMTRLPDTRKDLVVPSKQDLSKECSCDEYRPLLTPTEIMNWHRNNVYGRQSTWNIDVEAIGAIWVSDRNTGSTCKHRPSNVAVFVPQPTREEVK